MFEISELKLKKLPELQELAKTLAVPKFKSLKKLDLVYQILDYQAANPAAVKKVIPEVASENKEATNKPEKNNRPNKRETPHRAPRTDNRTQKTSPKPRPNPRKKENEAPTPKVKSNSNTENDKKSNTY
jgi:transcription termination factor Rho